MSTEKFQLLLQKLIQKIEKSHKIKSQKLFFQKTSTFSISLKFKHEQWRLNYYQQEKGNITQVIKNNVLITTNLETLDTISKNLEDFTGFVVIKLNKMEKEAQKKSKFRLFDYFLVFILFMTLFFNTEEEETA